MPEKYFTIISFRRDDDKLTRGSVGQFKEGPYLDYLRKKAESGEIDIAYEGSDLDDAVAALNKAVGLEQVV